MPFEYPTTDEPRARALQASDLVLQALRGLIADANAAGWATDEIVAAMAEAARQVKQANLKDPDPADDPDISDVPPDHV